jgi:hypothetical protein
MYNLVNRLLRFIGDKVLRLRQALALLRSRKNAKAISPLPIGPAFETMEDVILGLEGLGQALFDRRDRRAVFVIAYLHITREMKHRIDGDWFQDGPWVARYVVAFANLYRQALAAFEAGDLDTVPKPWRIAFEASSSEAALVIQDLLLGINAHINYDLPLALTEVSIDPERARCYQDHTAVNEALRVAINPIQDRLGDLYAPGLSLLDRVLGPLDEDLTAFSFVKAREGAWGAGVALANARSAPERTAVRERLNDQAAVLGRLMLKPTADQPWLFRALRYLERLEPWWRYVTLPEDGAGEIAAPVDVPPLVDSLEAVMARLEAIIDRYDNQGSRMSVYPTVYLLITRRVKAALDQGRLFADGDWITQLDLHFASQYFRALEAFEAGRLEAIPGCWLTAFQATSDQETTILQDLVLAVNARLNHDLAIALLRTGFDEANLERQWSDYEQIHVIFQEGIDPVQDLLAQKYSQFLKFLDIIGGCLDEMVVDFSYTRARDAAWDNGLTLARAGSDAERQTLIREMDRRATVLGQKILLKHLTLSSWIVEALQHVERAFSGRWSDWVRG